MIMPKKWSDIFKTVVNKLNLHLHTDVFVKNLSKCSEIARRKMDPRPQCADRIRHVTVILISQNRKECGRSAKVRVTSMFPHAALLMDSKR